MRFPKRADAHGNGATVSGEEAEDGEEADAVAVTARRGALAGGCWLFMTGAGSFVHVYRLGGVYTFGQGRLRHSFIIPTFQFVAAIDPDRHLEDMKDTCFSKRKLENSVDKFINSHSCRCQAHATTCSCHR